MLLLSVLSQTSFVISINWTILQAWAHIWRSFLSYISHCLCDCACMCVFRGLFGVCMFVWPCGWQDFAELCFCHDYTWWNKASGSQMESLCMGAFVAFPGPSTAETLTSHNTSLRKELKLKIKYYLTGIAEWSVKRAIIHWQKILQASLSPFGTFLLKMGTGFPSEKIMLWQRD